MAPSFLRWSSLRQGYGWQRALETACWFESSLGHIGCRSFSEGSQRKPDSSVGFFLFMSGQNKESNPTKEGAGLCVSPRETIWIIRLTRIIQSRALRCRSPDEGTSRKMPKLSSCCQVKLRILEQCHLSLARVKWPGLSLRMIGRKHPLVIRKAGLKV